MNAPGASWVADADENVRKVHAFEAVENPLTVERWAHTSSRLARRVAGPPCSPLVRVAKPVGAVFYLLPGNGRSSLTSSGRLESCCWRCMYPSKHNHAHSFGVT